MGQNAFNNGLNNRRKANTVQEKNHTMPIAGKR